MEETFNSSFAQPPKKVRTLRTVAALLLMVSVLPSVINGILSIFLDIRHAISLFGTLGTIAQIAGLLGLILLIVVVSEKSARYCIILIAVISLLVSMFHRVTDYYHPEFHYLYVRHVYIISGLLTTYAYSVLLQSKRLSKQSLMWITWFCILAIVGLSTTIGSTFIKNYTQGNAYFMGVPFLSCFINILSMIAYWKFCHSELFEGGASGEIDMKRFSPLNKYMLTALIMIAFTAGIITIYDRFIVDLLNN